MTRSAEIDIEIVETHDQDAHPLDYLFLDPDYREQDEARLEAWRHDEWHFVGIRAKAAIKIPYDSNPDSYIIAELSSHGLWGIESDSGDAYFQQVYQEERALLITMLAIIAERGALPPQDQLSPRSSRDLPFPPITDSEAPPIRPEYLPNSIASIRRRLIVALARHLPRCPCCNSPIRKTARIPDY